MSMEPITESARQPQLSDDGKATMPRLRQIYSPAAGFSAPSDHQLLIGRTPLGRELLDGDGIIINDSRVSRLHCTIHVSADFSVTLVDEKSKNATYVNGQAIRAEVPLNDADIIRIGDTFFILRREDLATMRPEAPEFVGCAPSLEPLRNAISQVGPANEPVLILGETGTGKELIANAIHRKSGRRGQFVAVNCASIPENLAESLLFGHHEGVFTGAKKAQPGLMRTAQGGTLFLDEVGELPLPIQAKLLRALQDHIITPLGAVSPTTLDLRVIAATHKPLETLVSAGTFRQDLYARLAGIILRIPPLRERKEDVLPLLDHALHRARPDAPPPRLSPELVEALLLYSWPSNTRELIHVAAQLRLLGATPELLARLKNVSTPPPADAPPPASAASPVRRRPRPGEAPKPTRPELLALMSTHCGVIVDVAKALGCSRRQVGRLLEQFEIDPDTFRS